MIALGYNFWSEWELQEKVDFDGINKLIIVYPHVTELDIRADVWSAWVRWDYMLARNYNRFLEAMERTGLDDIPGGQTGDMYFLSNGWRLVVDIEKVKISGVLYSRDFDTAYYTSELVAIYPAQVSSIVNTVDTIAVTGTPDEVAEAVADFNLIGYMQHGTIAALLVRDAYGGTIYVDINNETGNAEAGVLFPTGMYHRPVNNVPDLLALLEAFHISKVIVNGDLPIPDNTNTNGITFESNGTIDRTVTMPISATTNGCKFRGLIITGYLTGRTEFDKCTLDTVRRFRGEIRDSSIQGPLDFNDDTGATSIISDSHAEGGGSIPQFIINGAKVSVINWVGWAQFTDKTGDSVLGVSTTAGIFTVLDSCAAGSFMFAGTGVCDDLSADGCNVNSDDLLNKEGITKEVVTYNGEYHV